MDITSLGKRKAGLLVRTTSLCVLITFAIAFFATPMTSFAGDGGVGDVTVMGTITFGSQVKLLPSQAIDPQNHLPLFQFRLTPNSSGQPIQQGAWVVVKWKNVDCNGKQLQPPTKMGFGTLNGDNVTYGQGFSRCDSGQNGNITNEKRMTLATTKKGNVNSNASAKFVGSLINSRIAPNMVSFDLSPKGYSLVNGQLQNTLREGDWFVVSVRDGKQDKTVFAMYTRKKQNLDMAMLGDGVEQLPPSMNLKAGNKVKLLPNDGTLPQQSSGGIISWSATAGTGWG